MLSYWCGGVGSHTNCIVTRNPVLIALSEIGWKKKVFTKRRNDFIKMNSLRKIHYNVMN
jgi:hypothetical protein